MVGGTLNFERMFLKKFIAVLISILFLSSGWLGCTGLTLLVALVPLLWISSASEDSRRGWWSTFGWALLTFIGWNLSTIWWIGYATPIGPFAATLASSFYSMLAFMLFHTISKRAPKALAYTLLVSIWIAFEYNYTVSDFSWPWLLLGNGFSNQIWTIQWYEYTGIFGGSLWVLLSNILFFEAVKCRIIISKWISATIVAVVPLLISVCIYLTYNEADDSTNMEMSVLQPNVDCYDRFYDDNMQEANLISLLDDVPRTTKLILMPEGAVPGYNWERNLNRVPFFNELRRGVSIVAPDASLIFGTYTMYEYKRGDESDTARPTTNGSIYYDLFNTAVAIVPNDDIQFRHKARLVIGVENTPTWIFDIFKFFVIEIGDQLGQIGKGEGGEVFEIDGHKVGAAVCYEGLYGDFFAEFVRNGAEVMSIISNDSWWEDTPGHKHLYTLSAIRAVETRRAIARSANTGTSGFITARGDSIESMGWEERGVLTETLTLSNKMTIYTIYGDYIARIASFVAALSLMYYLVYRSRKRHHLV